MKLRPYQEKCCNNIADELTKATSTLAVMPTGMGKTVTFGHVAKRAKKDVLILAHREELIFQAQDKIEAITGTRPDVEMGDIFARQRGMFDGKSHVLVSSVQTQNAGKKCKCGGSCFSCVDGVRRRMQHFDPHQFELVIIDEAHHATSPSYKRILNYYKSKNPDIKILGVTATPDRADEKALGQVFDTVAFEYSLPQAIDDGWLVPIHQEWVNVEGLDFSNIRTVKGDLCESELQKVMEEEEALHGVVTPMMEIAGDRATLLFCVGVEQAKRCCEIINRHKKDSAIFIHGKTPKEERRELLKEFENGKYQYICNCGVFLEGFDEPRIQVVAMARPTKSRSLYAQCVGRGTRATVPLIAETPEERRAAIQNSNKPSMLVIDFVGNSGRHKLVSSADILGGDYEDDVVDAAVKEAKEKSKADPDYDVDMQAELAKAAEEKARKRREAVKAKAKYSRQAISPFDLFDVTPPREPGWHKGRQPTRKQQAALAKMGVDQKEIDGMSFWQASKMLDTLIKRIDGNKCSFKQAKILQRFGQSTDVSFQEASALIDRIAKNGWKPLA